MSVDRYVLKGAATLSPWYGFVRLCIVLLTFIYLLSFSLPHILGTGIGQVCAVGCGDSFVVIFVISSWLCTLVANIYLLSFTLPS